MKFTAILALLPFALTPAVFAAPPGIMQFQTIADPAGCSGHDLTTIGFIGSSGASCVSLSDTAPTDNYLNYFLDNLCTINLFSQAGCNDDAVVLSIPPPGIPTQSCINVDGGFRALNVTCASS